MGAAKVVGAFLGMGTKMFGNAFGAADENQNNQENSLALTAESGSETAQAADAEARGAILAGRTRMAGAQLAAKQSLAYSNSGVDASVGTPSSTIAGSQLFNELDAKTVENNAAREAWGHTKLANSLRRKGDQVDRTIANSQRDYYLKQAGTMLGGAGDIAGGSS